MIKDGVRNVLKLYRLANTCDIYLFLRSILGPMYFELDELFILQQAVLRKIAVPRQPVHPTKRLKRSERDNHIEYMNNDIRFSKLSTESQFFTRPADKETLSDLGCAFCECRSRRGTRECTQRVASGSSK